jgi:hypothetical protein
VYLRIILISTLLLVFVVYLADSLGLPTLIVQMSSTKSSKYLADSLHTPPRSRCGCNITLVMYKLNASDDKVTAKVTAVNF